MSGRPDLPTTGGERDYTTVAVDKDLRQRLEDLKPYESVSYSDLIADMCDSWVDDRADFNE